MDLYQRHLGDVAGTRLHENYPSPLHFRSSNDGREISPDIAPSDYYLFRSMAHGLADQQFCSYKDIEKWLDSRMDSDNDKYSCKNEKHLVQSAYIFLYIKKIRFKNF